MALVGVLLGVFLERPLRPYNVTQKRWVGRQQWVEIALIVGVFLGMLLSVADSLGRGIPLSSILEQIWIPLYRASMFAAGVTLLRRVASELEKTDRSRGRPRGDEMASAVPVIPALPRNNPPERRSTSRGPDRENEGL